MSTAIKPVHVRFSITVGALLLLAFVINVSFLAMGGVKLELIHQPSGLAWVNHVVGGVWAALMSGMIVSVVRLLRVKTQATSQHALMVAVFVIFCALYHPTFGITPEGGLAGHLVTLGLAAWVGFTVRKTSRLASGLMIGAALWVGVASIFLTQAIALNS